MNMNKLDGRLIAIVMDNLLREGSVCSAELLVALNPTIRRYLRDRRLVHFLKGNMFGIICIAGIHLLYFVDVM